jgi:hypothetical protein
MTRRCLRQCCLSLRSLSPGYGIAPPIFARSHKPWRLTKGDCGLPIIRSGTPANRRPADQHQTLGEGSAERDDLAIMSQAKQILAQSRSICVTPPFYRHARRVLTYTARAAYVLQ